MDLRKLKTLIDLVAESGIAELEITEGDGKVRIVKSPQQVAMGYAPMNPVTMAPEAPRAMQAAEPPAAPPAQAWPSAATTTPPSLPSR